MVSILDVAALVSVFAVASLLAIVEMFRPVLALVSPVMGSPSVPAVAPESLYRNTRSMFEVSPFDLYAITCIYMPLFLFKTTNLLTAGAPPAATISK